VKNIFISQQGGIFELHHIVIKVNGYDFYSIAGEPQFLSNRTTIHIN